MKAKYLKDIIYAANDGIITTFAVVAGVAGAHLDTSIILILGFANLFADGFSMGISDYLGTKSEEEYLARDGTPYDGATQENPRVAALVTLFAFVVAGLLPIVPYLFFGFSENVLTISVVATAIALFVVGSLRSIATGRHWFWSGIEMLVIGGVAAVIAYATGTLLSGLMTRN